MSGIIVAVGIHHGNGSLQQTVGVGVFEQCHPVVANLIQAGFADELGEILLAAEDGIFEAGIDKGIAVSLETLVDNFENTDALFGRNVFHVGLQHLLSYNPLHFGEGDGREILVGGNLQTVGGGFYPGFILAFQGRNQGGGTRNPHEVESRNQCFLNGLLMIESIAAMLHDAAYLVESLLIRTVVQGTAACKELFLLCAFRI